MNDRLAEVTIKDHKYLLELMENRAAIAYFAVANRNASLFNALNNYIRVEMQEQDASLSDSDNNGAGGSGKGGKGRKKKKNMTPEEVMKNYLVKLVQRIALEYDFMSLVMYPEL